MSENQTLKDNSLTTTETPEKIKNEQNSAPETFETAYTLEDFTQSLMNSLTSKLHANIDDIFKQNK